MSIKFKQTTITPKIAAAYLEDLNRAIESGKFAQRNPSKSAVARMAADMRRGNFALTHQAVALNEAGYLIDGRQRFMAVCAANVPIEMIVATNVPNYHDGKTCKIPSMDLIDSGRNRTFGQVLSGIHAVRNGHLIAATLRTIAEIVTKENSLTKAQGMELRTLLGEEIELIIAASSVGQTERRAWVLAPFVIASTVDRDGTVQFVEKFCMMANIPQKSPILALRTWISLKGGSSGKQRRSMSLVTANALAAHFGELTIDSLQPNFEGMEMIMKEASGIVKKIKQILSTQ